ncbi:hypothetical protein ABZW10_15670 [Kitasatospora sp. NPDC004723]|uniref:hypothetical protein n=1 Tax=Kitasatospora sp. NPDC004723 TaxID=3154288 RepID=UPI0033BB5387
MTEDRRISGGLHISGNANVSFSGSGVAAGEHSSVTVHSTSTPVDEEALARRVLALAEQLRGSADPARVQAAEDLEQAVAAPARRWEQVLAYLARAGQGLAATTAVAVEIQGLDTAVRALLP